MSKDSEFSQIRIKKICHFPLFSRNFIDIIVCIFYNKTIVKFSFTRVKSMIRRDLYEHFI